MTATPGLGVWASCGDYGLEHNLVDCTGPAGEDEPWICCTRCADSWPRPSSPADPFASRRVATTKRR